MLTEAQFDSLEPGDQIETVAPFLFSKESVVLQTALKTEREGKPRLEFIVTYFNITMGRWACEKTSGGLQWLVA